LLTPADTASVHVRAHDENGFGMIELLIAMIMLSIGLLAIVGALDAATVAVSRSHYISGAVAVADQQMETYRSLDTCAIWLDHNEIPASGSTYASDTQAYNDTATSTPQVSYYDASKGAAQPWVTDATDGVAYTQTNLQSCVFSTTSDITLPLDGATAPSSMDLITPPASAVEPVQEVAGPGGTKYLVYTYIVLTQPTGGEYTKQVTVVVRDDSDPTQVLAREVSIFDPALSP
jgi:prepilin-type N-terminal cleavage/methylation domain-containing protein